MIYSSMSKVLNEKQVDNTAFNTMFKFVKITGTEYFSRIKVALCQKKYESTKRKTS